MLLTNLLKQSIECLCHFPSQDGFSVFWTEYHMVRDLIDTITPLASDPLSPTNETALSLSRVSPTLADRERHRAPQAPAGSSAAYA